MKIKVNADLISIYLYIMQGLILIDLFCCNYLDVESKQNIWLPDVEPRPRKGQKFYSYEDAYEF